MDRIDRETMLDLFIHPGWKLFIDEAREALRTAVETTHLLEAEHELWKRKGEIQQLSQMVNYADLIKAQMDEELRHGDVE